MHTHFDHASFCLPDSHTRLCCALVCVCVCVCESVQCLHFTWIWAYKLSKAACVLCACHVKYLLIIIILKFRSIEPDMKFLFYRSCPPTVVCSWQYLMNSMVCVRLCIASIFWKMSLYFRCPSINWIKNCAGGNFYVVQTICFCAQPQRIS